jgi:aspartate carbamoyltransferase regulatory subunit
MVVVKELKVNAIEKGTVIDQINPESLFNIIRVLDLEKRSDEILIGTNLKSKKIGKKGVLKISNLFLEKAELDKISILARNSKINIIKNYEVVKKFELPLPTKVENLIKCFNPNYITNFEKVNTFFTIIHDSPLKLKCKYCEKLTEKDQIQFI